MARKTVDYQESFVELERTRELSKQLVNTVKPLQEDGTPFIHIIGCCALTATIGKLVTKLQPFFLHQDTETLSYTATCSYVKMRLNLSKQGNNQSLTYKTKTRSSISIFRKRRRKASLKNTKQGKANLTIIRAR